MNGDMLEVAAAILRDGDRILICRRPASKMLGLLWEFPGGKREPEETLEDCLARECREELGVDTALREPFLQLCHEYPDFSVCLSFFSAVIRSGTICLHEHSDACWVLPEDLHLYDFCPADQQVIAALRDEANAAGGEGQP